MAGEAMGAAWLMKKTLIMALALVLGLASAGFGVEIGDLAWNESNIKTLRAADKAAVAHFMNKLGSGDDSITAVKPSDILEFEWVDLAGDGKYELVLTESSGPNAYFLSIYWQEGPGKFRDQSLPGAATLKTAIRDLDRDGTDEIVLYVSLDPSGFRGARATPVWPRVYRLHDGEYVDASSDFPEFYTDEVLPKLDQEIAGARRKWPPGSEFETNAAVLEMQRDKILRVLGRDPTAGLAEAREWARSQDPDMIENAIVVFRDIGGHEAEARAAEQASKRAWQQREKGE
jgi:hypothetical protein